MIGIVCVCFLFALSDYAMFHYARESEVKSAIFLDFLEMEKENDWEDYQKA